MPEPSLDPLRTIDHVPAPADTSNETGLEESTGPYIPAPPADAPAIPGYALEAEIAQGGMGRVFAGRDLTLDREVAIKTLLPGANAERFIVESKITARLPHPGIPPVHALGTLDDGTPYLAMKLIRGRTLADLLKARGSPQEELSRYVQIFEQIAQAVGFAHAQGIIHRDLKPRNVMVGAFGEVQVMDWGLAKASLPRPREESASASSLPREREASPIPSSDEFHTSAGAVMGTPGYMAPEQARGEVVDARADVFALGSVLAAILTGKPAFVGATARETIAKAASSDLTDVLQRLDASGADAGLIASAKRCLAADANDRPADAQVVADEVAAYRAGVEQRLRQAETQAAEALVREAEQRKRRRVMQWAGGAIAAVLLMGIGGTTFGLIQAWKQEEIAKEQEVEARRQETLAKGETQAKERALKKETEERGYAEAISKFVQDDVLAMTSVEGQDRFAGEQHEHLSKDATLRQLLDRAAAKLKVRKGLSPRVEAELNWIIGVSYRGEGVPTEAIPFLEKAVELRCHSLGYDKATLNAMNSLAVALRHAERKDEALRLHEETLKLQKAHLGADHLDTLTSMNNLALCYRSVGKIDRALPLLKEALELSKARWGAEHRETLICMSNLGSSYHVAGKLDLALEIIEEARKRMKANLGADHRHTLATASSLAFVYKAAGKFDLALSLYKETFELQKAKFGADHSSTLSSMDSLALAHQEVGELNLALPLFEAVLVLRTTKLGALHRDTLTSKNNLAMALVDERKFERALPLLEETLNSTDAVKPLARGPGGSGFVQTVAVFRERCDQWCVAKPTPTITTAAPPSWHQRT